MYQVSMSTTFSAAHRLQHYKGKCEDLHGHNFKVEVRVKSPRLGETGMVIDFKVLKEKTEKLLSSLDHKYLNEVPYFTEINPSSENIAQYIFWKLKEELKETQVRLREVRVWESENAWASFSEE